jgi:hypothetical protein
MKKKKGSKKLSNKEAKSGKGGLGICRAGYHVVIDSGKVYCVKNSW